MYRRGLDKKCPHFLGHCWGVIPVSLFGPCFTAGLHQINSLSGSGDRSVHFAEITLPVLMTRGIAGSQLTLCGEWGQVVALFCAGILHLSPLTFAV